jgi:hypothetical protein
MSNLIGTVKSINSTKAGNLIVECIDNQQYKTLLKSTHLGEWVIKVYVPKSMNTSIGCIYNVPLNITEDEIKDVLKQQNVSNCVRLTYFDIAFTVGTFWFINRTLFIFMLLTTFKTQSGLTTV